ncbi:hypothetical protein TNCV_4598871 [Trichonephila clavipes]|nr:hypothetical protein TNCV_4598871 [Trichonephila clavipes]
MVAARSPAESSSRPDLINFSVRVPSVSVSKSGCIPVLFWRPLHSQIPERTLYLVRLIYSDWSGASAKLPHNGENNSTQQQERTTQFGSRNETTQLVSRNETTQLCTAVDRLQLNSSVGTKQLNSALPSTACNRLYSRIGFFYLLTCHRSRGFFVKVSDYVRTVILKGT